MTPARTGTASACSGLRRLRRSGFLACLGLRLVPRDGRERRGARGGREEANAGSPTAPPRGAPRCQAAPLAPLRTLAGEPAALGTGTAHRFSHTQSLPGRPAGVSSPCPPCRRRAAPKRVPARDRPRPRHHYPNVRDDTLQQSAHPESATTPATMVASDAIASAV